MHRLKFSIKTLSPIVITSTSNSTVMTGTHSAFGGSIIRGIFASRFVEEQKLNDEAHDKNFREIFFGGLKFLPANPEISGKRSFVLPLSLQSGKSGTVDGDKVQDLLADEKTRRGYKSFRGFGVRKRDEFFTVNVKKNIFMHMSRSGKGIVDGKEVFERLTGKSEFGGIYNYEAIDAGQNFIGEIIGDEKLLIKLRDGLNLDGGEMTAYVGRSKFTQYGKCLVTFGEIEDLPETNFDAEIFLRLDTPLIPVDDCFIGAEKILTAEVVNKLFGKFELGKVFSSGIEVENFVVPWGMKRPRVSALAAGTVFELKLTAALTEDEKKFFVEKIYGGFGTRTEEGFGQLRIWTPAKNFVKGKSDDEKISRPEFSDYTTKLAKKILKAHLLERIRIFAQEDAKKLGNQLQRDNVTHFFTRLDGILANSGKENVRKSFKEQLQIEVRKGSRFEDHLENFRMANNHTNNHKFAEVFMRNGKFPRAVGDLLNEPEIAAVKGVIDFGDKDFSDDEFFLEYLKNYFRFARKLAATSKGGDKRG